MRLFVYGTLLSGETYHRILGDSPFLGPAETAPCFDLVSLGGYPALLTGGVTAVRGELYDIDDETLEWLDELEGHPTLYQRREIPLADGSEAIAYLMRRELAGRGQPLDSGDWRER